MRSGLGLYHSVVRSGAGGAQPADRRGGRKRAGESQGRGTGPAAAAVSAEALGSVETLAMTTIALRDAAALGFGRHGVVAVIASMERRMFVKSMITFADHRVWQDVYQLPAEDLVLYVKFQADVVTEFRVMSFKER